MDLTKIDKTFGELDQVTQWALMGAAHDNKRIEFLFNGTNEWVLRRSDKFDPSVSYRLKPEPVKKTVSFEMGVSAYPHTAPLISEGHARTKGWQHGTTTVDLVDDKAVRIVWEPSK